MVHRETKSGLTANELRQEQGLILLSCWTRDGLSKDTIAEKLGISRMTLYNWEEKYPEIKEALSKSKEIIDYEVENALLKAALGYRAVETKTIISGSQNKSGNRVVKIEKVEKEVGPNVTACLAWLNNKKPKEWHKNRENEVEISDEMNNVTINIIKHRDKEEDLDEWKDIDTSKDDWSEFEESEE